MKNNKLISTLILGGLTGITLYSINKSINIFANTNADIHCYNGDFYTWRYGNIYYTKHGTGKPLLLIHELSCGGSDLEWKNTVEKLSENYTVYTLDLLGCGRSDKPSLTYTNYLYVQLISDFIKNIIGKRCDVITSGKSSSFIIMACYNDNSLFDKIVFINPESIDKTNKKLSNNNKLIKILLEMPIIGTTIYNITHSKKNYINTINSKFNNKNAGNKIPKYYYDASHYGTMTSKYLFASLSTNYTCINVANALKNINNSITIIGGESEPNILNTCLEYQEYNPAIETCIIDNSKSLPQLETPEKFLENVIVYL